MNSFLDLIDRHKIGILSTIALHLFVVMVFLIVQMRSKVEKEPKQMVVEFIQPELMEKALQDMQKEIKQQSHAEFIRDMQQEYLGKNIPVNEADEAAKANKSIDDMVKGIKSELGVSDNPTYDREAEKNQPKVEEIKKKDVAKVERKADFINEKGEPSVFRGATTISYNLKGRSYVYIPTPTYKCQGGGKVVLDVIVNQRGFVISATINRAKSQISEECIAETANNAALITRFNEKADAPAKEPGTLTFIFVAQ
jgi:hypothetical protein